MKNELVVILSHADTTDKVEVLKKCILEIKKQNYPILISSHIEIQDDIKNLTDYFIYDKENPLIVHNEFPNLPHVHIWMSTPFYEQIYSLEYNHSYAVLRLIKNGIGIAYANGFNKVHFVNYDYVLYDESILNRHSDFLNRCDLFSYFYRKFEENIEHINTGLFSVKVKPFLEIIKDINSKEQFLERGQSVFEKFLYYESIKNGLTIERDDQEDLLKTRNIMNNKSTLKNVINDKIHVYLSQENETKNHFIFIKVDDNENLELNIKTDSQSFIYVPKTNGSINLIQIPENVLEKGVELFIPNYNFKEFYNLNTHPANCKIHDRSIITPIENLLPKKSKSYSIDTYCDPNLPKRYDVMNFLIQENNFSDYLEIGVHNGDNIKKINIKNKDGVDPGAEGFIADETNYIMTSDDFFDVIDKNKKYDMIFIDGLHHSEQVDKDVKNSLEHLNENGYIILHDCNPPEEFLQKVPRESVLWNGDVWKTIVKLRHSRSDLEISVIDIDWGVGVIRRGNQETLNKFNLEECLNYDFMSKNREELLNIISIEDFYLKYRK